MGFVTVDIDSLDEKINLVDDDNFIIADSENIDPVTLKPIAKKVKKTNVKTNLPFVTVGDSTINSRGLDGQYPDIKTATDLGFYNIKLTSDTILGGIINGLPSSGLNYNLNIVSDNKDFVLEIESGEYIDGNTVTYPFKEINIQNLTLAFVGTGYIDISKNNLKFKNVKFDLTGLNLNRGAIYNVGGGVGVGSSYIEDYEVVFPVSTANLLINDVSAGTNFHTLLRGKVTQANSGSNIITQYVAGPNVVIDTIDFIGITGFAQIIPIGANIKNLKTNNAFTIVPYNNLAKLENIYGVGTITFVGFSSITNSKTSYLNNIECTAFNLQQNGNNDIVNVQVNNVVASTMIFGTSVYSGRTYKNITFNHVRVLTNATLNNNSGIFDNVVFNNCYFEAVNTFNVDNCVFNNCTFNSAITITGNNNKFNNCPFNNNVSITGSNNVISFSDVLTNFGISITGGNRNKLEGNNVGSVNLGSSTITINSGTGNIIIGNTTEAAISDSGTSTLPATLTNYNNLF